MEGEWGLKSQYNLLLLEINLNLTTSSNSLTVSMDRGQIQIIQNKICYGITEQLNSIP